MAWLRPSLGCRPSGRPPGGYGSALLSFCVQLIAGGRVSLGPALPVRPPAPPAHIAAWEGVSGVLHFEAPLPSEGGPMHLPVGAPMVAAPSSRFPHRSHPFTAQDRMSPGGSRSVPQAELVSPLVPGRCTMPKLDVSGCKGMLGTAARSGTRVPSEVGMVSGCIRMRVYK